MFLLQQPDEKELTVLMPAPELPYIESSILDMQGFGMALYADLVLDFISIGYGESLYNVISRECDELHLPDNYTATIIHNLEVVAQALLQHILTRQNLHFLLICDIGEVEILDNGDWLIKCNISESKYDMFRASNQYNLIIPKYEHSTFTPNNRQTNNPAGYNPMGYQFRNGY